MRHVQFKKEKEVIIKSERDKTTKLDAWPTNRQSPMLPGLDRALTHDSCFHLSLVFPLSIPQVGRYELIPLYTKSHLPKQKTKVRMYSCRASLIRLLTLENLRSRLRTAGKTESVESTEHRSRHDTG